MLSVDNTNLPATYNVGLVIFYSVELLLVLIQMHRLPLRNVRLKIKR